ncbi:hypothetical protein BaRGS_00019998 [Batillaria attramentaria]|uniref:inositol-polyphosphate 5-phosphatase n=1 Tax=Batillaria attramentaria TaxID=370345 RepID=A0ABD0KNJ9_9CAEN
MFRGRRIPLAPVQCCVRQQYASSSSQGEAGVGKVNLLACEELQRYDRARIFLDEDYTAADRFTALGNLYFIHEDIDNVLIWDFVDCKFVAVEGREVLSGNIENVPIKEKAKFPQHFFPEFKWSRKGFLRTRWSINNCIFDLVNIHLFHDASNIVAMETSPSLYSGNRRRALLHTLQRFENDQYSKVPLFIFGDFNFRLDSCLLIKALTAKAVPQQTLGKKDQVNKVVYTEEGNGKVVLTVETKSFDCHDKHTDIFTNTLKWLLQYDTEMSSFHDRLYEHEISFPPSYPFTEDVNDGLSYMKTRVPSWCDRILLSHSAKDIISSESHHKPDYGLIGRDTCMGDHKPVSLYLRLKPGKGNPLDDSFVSVVDLPARKRGLSINGERVPERDLDCINIHDFAVFEKEQELIPEFRVSIKSRSSGSSEGQSPIGPVGGEGEGEALVPPPPKVARTPSFKRIAQQVRVVERVLLRWPRRPRSRHHSSSSEDYCDADDEANNNNSSEALKKGGGDADVLSVDTVTSQLSAEDIHIETNEKLSDLKDDQTGDEKRIGAQPIRDVHLNSKEVSPSSVKTHANQQEKTKISSGQTESQTLTDSQVGPLPPKPECCDSADVVHDAPSMAGAPAPQVKRAEVAAAAPAPQSKCAQASTCPCVVL